ncbi:MAG: hypothetical protein LCI03_19985, partial [Actinobacteria bacterium]|nr:hypothetical protein [Actinomycetota bacterium]
MEYKPMNRAVELRKESSFSKCFSRKFQVEIDVLFSFLERQTNESQGVHPQELVLDSDGEFVKRAFDAKKLIISHLCSLFQPIFVMIKTIST